jgi:hypothetical protein
MAATGSSRIKKLKKLMRNVKPRRAKRSARAAWWTSRWTIAGAVVLLFTTAILVGVRQGLNAIHAPRRADSRTARVETPPETATTITPPQTESAPRPEPLQPAAVDQADDHASAPVTITGCLERSDNAFRLTDAAGASAPTTRNWKSAFLKKRSAPIGIVAAAQLNLKSHVGQRVKVTGTLVDREMHVGSLQRMASSCTTQKAKTI